MRTGLNMVVALPVTCAAIVGLWTTPLMGMLVGLIAIVLVSLAAPADSGEEHEYGDA